MVSADEVQQQINKGVEGLLYVNSRDNYQHSVCMVCEELLMPDEVEVLSLEQHASAHLFLTSSIRSDVPAAVSCSYKYKDLCRMYN